MTGGRTRSPASSSTRPRALGVTAWEMSVLEIEADFPSATSSTRGSRSRPPTRLSPQRPSGARSGRPSSPDRALTSGSAPSRARAAPGTIPAVLSRRAASACPLPASRRRATPRDAPRARHVRRGADGAELPKPLCVRLRGCLGLPHPAGEQNRVAGRRRIRMERLDRIDQDTASGGTCHRRRQWTDPPDGSRLHPVVRSPSLQGWERHRGHRRPRCVRPQGRPILPDAETPRA
jgi:hypothetical protein